MSVASGHIGGGADGGSRVRRWSVGRTIGFAVLALIVFYTAQIVAVGVALIGKALTNPAFDLEAAAQTAGTDGVLLAVGTIAGAAVTIPFLRFLVGRREPAPWHFLGFRAVSAATIGKWLAWLSAFIVVSDGLTIALGRPIVPEFMTMVYETASPVLLLAALCIAAPLCEEVLFRGFLLSALRSSGLSIVVVATLSSAIWALIHIQYDLYGIGSIFVMGLLLAAARIKTGSLWPCIGMHALANAIATAEVAFTA